MLALFGSECTDHLPTMRCAGMQLSLPLLRVPFVLPFSPQRSHAACWVAAPTLLGKLLPKCHVALHIRCLEHSLTKNPETSLLNVALHNRRLEDPPTKNPNLALLTQGAHWATRSCGAALCMPPAEVVLKNSAKLLGGARRRSPRAMSTPTKMKMGMLLGLGRQQGMCGCT